MNTKHILNIGYPKSGTTWLWQQLTLQSWFSRPRGKENDDLITGTPVCDYVQDYSSMAITGNFSTSNFALDRYVIKQLSEIEITTVTIILRCLFDLLNSLYNFSPKSQHFAFEDWCSNLDKQAWFTHTAKILDRWRYYFPDSRFAVFCFDHLKKDPKMFFEQYCSALDLPGVDRCATAAINTTDYKFRPIFDADMVDRLNGHIDDLQSRIWFDIQHWKKPYQP